jgi:NADH-quinone oxidoreductase subunit N
MSIDSLVSILPLLVLSTTIIIVLLISAFLKKHALTFTGTLSGLALALGVLTFLPQRGAVITLLVIDSYSVFYIGLILISALIVVILSYPYLCARQRTPIQMSEGVPREHLHEYYLLLLLATLGSAVIVASSHFATFFLGLEILSISLYALISYRRENSRGIEAGIKYLILAGASSAFMLFGMALIYASLGTMEFMLFRAALDKHLENNLLIQIGSVMIFVGIGFKLAVVPFHMWAPDIYEGAPVPITAFIATVSKGAVFALLLRYFRTNTLYPNNVLYWMFMLVGVGSMFVGNFLALKQDNIKRLLAYSSITHLGYLLIALLVEGKSGANAATFYLVSYLITIMIAFGAITLVSGPKQDAEKLQNYQGLFWQRPFLALILSTSVLSLAGIPLTAGFIGKFYLVSAGISSALWFLVAILLLNSAISLYYYLRVIVVMFTSASISPGGGELLELRNLVPTGAAVLVLMSLLLVWLGIYPSPMLHLIQNMTESLPP